MWEVVARAITTSCPRWHSGARDAAAGAARAAATAPPPQWTGPVCGCRTAAAPGALFGAPPLRHPAERADLVYRLRREVEIASRGATGACTACARCCCGERSKEDTGK